MSVLFDSGALCNLPLRNTQTNRSVDLSSEGFEEPQQQGDINAKHNSRTWGRRHASRSSSTSKCAGEMLELEGEDKRTLERRMQREIIAAEEAGGDVDRLVMKRLLAGVRDSGPDTAYKALASIEVRRCVMSVCHRRVCMPVCVCVFHMI